MANCASSKATNTYAAGSTKQRQCLRCWLRQGMLWSSNKFKGTENALPSIVAIRWSKIYQHAQHIHPSSWKWQYWATRTPKGDATDSTWSDSNESMGNVAIETKLLCCARDYQMRHATMWISMPSKLTWYRNDMKASWWYDWNLPTGSSPLIAFRNSNCCINLTIISPQSCTQYIGIWIGHHFKHFGAMNTVTLFVSFA